LAINRLVFFIIVITRYDSASYCPGGFYSRTGDGNGSTSCSSDYGNSGAIYQKRDEQDQE